MDGITRVQSAFENIFSPQFNVDQCIVLITDFNIVELGELH